MRLPNKWPSGPERGSTFSHHHQSCHPSPRRPLAGVSLLEELVPGSRPGLHDLITLLWASSEAPQQHKGSTSPERCSLLAADTLHCGPTAQGVALESVSSPLTAGSLEFRPRPPPWPLPPCQSLSLLLPRPSPGLPTWFHCKAAFQLSFACDVPTH